MINKGQRAKGKGQKKGFALLIAVIVTSIILAAGLSIVDGAYKELILASTVKNSIQALYAADSGIECALYWDNVRGNPTETSYFISDEVDPIIREVSCGGKRLTVVIIPASSGSIANMWYRESEGSNTECAFVTLKNGSPDARGAVTVDLDSWGINSCNPEYNRRADRSLEASYIRY